VEQLDELKQIFTDSKDSQLPIMNTDRPFELIKEIEDIFCQVIQQKAECFKAQTKIGENQNESTN